LFIEILPIFTLGNAVAVMTLGSSHLSHKISLIRVGMSKR